MNCINTQPRLLWAVLTPETASVFFVSQSAGPANRYARNLSPDAAAILFQETGPAAKVSGGHEFWAVMRRGSGLPLFQGWQGAALAWCKRFPEPLDLVRFCEVPVEHWTYALTRGQEPEDRLSPAVGQGIACPTVLEHGRAS